MHIKQKLSVMIGLIGTYRIQQTGRGGGHHMKGSIHIINFLTHVQHYPLVQRGWTRTPGACDHFGSFQRRREHVPVRCQTIIEDIVFFVCIWGKVVVEL